MKKFFSDFKQFALRGNALELAVGIIIGGAFQSIVKSLVDDLISPVIGIFAKTNFDNLLITINGAEIKYGAFITAVINFIIMAFILFLLLRAITRISSVGHKEEAPAALTTKICPFCKSEIAIEASRCPHCTSALDDIAQ